MTTETQEWIHNTAKELIGEILAMTENYSLPCDDQGDAWIEKAENWVSYVGQHYKP
jgi:hypothetical protein